MFTEMPLGTGDLLSLPMDVKLRAIQGCRIKGLPADIGTYWTDQVDTKVCLTLCSHFRRTLGRIDKGLARKAIIGLKVLVDAGQALPSSSGCFGDVPGGLGMQGHDAAPTRLDK